MSMDAGLCLDSFPESVLEQWWSECDAAFESKRATLDDDLYRHGTYTFAYGFEPGAIDLSNRELLTTLKQLPEYSDWAVWLIATRRLAPYPAEGRIECWLPPGDGRSTARADFWRALSDGLLYLRRGYDEDSEGEYGEYGLEPQTVSSASLPLERLGEALLHARDLGRALGLRALTRVRVRARWDGLHGRKLDRRRGARSQTDCVESSSLLDLRQLDTDLVTPMQALTHPLFECFGFYEPPREVIAEHLEGLERRR